MASACVCRLSVGLARLASVVGVSGLLLVTGCGGSSTTNLNNKLFGSNDNGGDTLFDKAQIAYDTGNFASAEALTGQLLTTNPNDERAAILRGFVHLSMGGIDPFILARQLISLSSNSSGSTTTTSLTLGGVSVTGAQSGAATAASPASGGSSGTAVNNSNLSGSGTDASSTSHLLTELQTLINMSTTDQQNLIDHTFATTDIKPSPTQLSLFVGNNVIMVPKTVDSSLRSSVTVLKYMDQALSDVCAFVDSDVILSSDSSTRSSISDCTQTTVPRNYTDQAHFLWAFSHLIEAVAFENVLLYISPGNTQPSLDAVNSSLNGITSITSASQLTTLVSDVEEVSAAISKVFPTTTANSMITVTLTDLNTVVVAFAKLSGMPSSVEQSVNSAFTDITNVSKTVAGGTTALSNAQAFKTQVTTDLAKTVASKIQAAATASGTGGASASQVTQMCAAYSQIIDGAPATSAAVTSKPKACS